VSKTAERYSSASSSPLSSNAASIFSSIPILLLCEIPTRPPV
jgi:hypothetical protein